MGELIALAVVAATGRLDHLRNLLCVTAALASLVAAKPEITEPTVEMICHTSNPDECYPKIFQATSEFRKVHHDQDIPIGLHVRLDVQTGQKEAKLNVPDEQIPGLEGLPVDQAVVVVDKEDPPAQEAVNFRKGAPVYEPVGVVKPSDAEAEVFHEALSLVKKGVPRPTLFSFGRSNSSRFDAALEELADLAHDIYYGVKIAEDYAATGRLLCLMSTRDVFQGDRDIEGVASRAQKSAAIIAAAVQNNPTALGHIEQAWEVLMQTRCQSEGTVQPLGSLVFGSFRGREGCVIEKGIREAGPMVLKARLSALNGLLKSSLLRRDFLAHHGMKHILNLLVFSGDWYHEVHHKAANLVSMYIHAPSHH
jgi:nucleotide exchange factor SIL1